MSAAEAGSLPTYEPGKRLRYTYGPSGSSRGVRKFYEEAYWSDITAWLEKSEPRVTFQSPKRAEIIASESTPRDATHVGPKERPQQKQRWQEEQILQAMRDLGISPMALPKRRPGVAGVKADVRERLGDLHWTPSVSTRLGKGCGCSNLSLCRCVSLLPQVGGTVMLAGEDTQSCKSRIATRRTANPRSGAISPPEGTWRYKRRPRFRQHLLRLLPDVTDTPTVQVRQGDRSRPADHSEELLSAWGALLASTGESWELSAVADRAYCSTA